MTQVAKQSETVCLLPIIGCLTAAERILGPDRQWQSVNEQQKRFVNEFFTVSRNDAEKVPELTSIASYNVDEINKFLSSQGFSIQLPDFSRPDFGVASVLKVLVEWQKKGSITSVRDGIYPAVKLKEGVTFHTSQNAEYPIASIETKNGDTLNMTVFPNPPQGFDMVKQALLVHNSRKDVSRTYDSVVFPMIEYDEEIDISWMRGLNTLGDDGQPAIVSAAVQQTKFRMNEIGAKVESAVAMSMTRSCVIERKPDLIIDKPFLLWMVRPRMSQPYFVGYFTEKDWRRPASL